MTCGRLCARWARFARLLMDEVPAVSATPEAKTYWREFVIGARGWIIS